MTTQPLITTGCIMSVVGSIPGVDEWVSIFGSLGGMGVLFVAIKYTLHLLKKKDEIIDKRDEQIERLMSQLINNCKNCDLARAANKELIDKQ